LIGETGVGKTTIVREIAKEQSKNLVRVSVNGSMGVEEILGKWLVDKGTTKWQDGILTSAIRRGDWVVMDEINAALPEILFTLHSLLDDDRKIVLPEKDNEIVTPHDDFRFFATMNPPEEYAGTKDMNKALMSRFTAVIYVDVLSEVEEVKLLEKKGSDTDTAVKLVKIANILRDYKKKDNIFYFCSTRDLVQCVQLKSHGLSIYDAFTGSIENKMSKDEFKVVKADVNSVIKMPELDSSIRSISDLIAMASDAETKIKETETKLRAEFEAEKAKIIEDAKANAKDEVSDTFLKTLRELSTKK
jgi:midasin